MKSARKRFWSMVLGIGMAATMLPGLPVEAEEGNPFLIQTDLDFTSAKYGSDVVCTGTVENGGSGHVHQDKEYCWSWNFTENTLTLNGIALSKQSENIDFFGIKMPDNAKIVVNGENTIGVTNGTMLEPLV